ncbi:hypothetical protein CVT26_006975 [Gymnopilus dilepis]|uniref:Uncharacterized protein n=1 Tax=Gymnopilus dilepis TaxID=231916 RepID=A0A409W132_9AGAR|nr:hypothetical protein CVT26_006975 [Gymnopilus dilepis]
MRRRTEARLSSRRQTRGHTELAPLTNSRSTLTPTNLWPTPGFSPNQPQPLGFNANIEYLGTASPTENPFNCPVPYWPIKTSNNQQGVDDAVITSIRPVDNTKRSSTQTKAHRSVSRTRRVEPRHKYESAKTQRVGAAASPVVNLIKWQRHNETSNGGRVEEDTDENHKRPPERGPRWAQ